MQHLEQIQANATQHDLGVNEAGHQVKQLLCAPARHPTREGIGQRKTVKFGAGIEAFKPLQKPVMPRIASLQAGGQCGQIQVLIHCIGPG